MKTETRMDYLLLRQQQMNDLADMSQDEAKPQPKAAKRKKRKSGTTDGHAGGNSFFTAMVEIFFRRTSLQRARILSLINPSDGHPMLELCPDFGWFRALTVNNTTWTNLWPELTI